MVLPSWKLSPLALMLFTAGAPGLAWAGTDVPVCVKVIVRHDLPAGLKRARVRKSEARKARARKATPPASRPASSGDHAAEHDDEAQSAAQGSTAASKASTAKERATQAKLRQARAQFGRLLLSQSKQRQQRRSQSHGLLPLGQSPETYLVRLIEHFVTHEPGFVAVTEGCKERLQVELYPLRRGWTAFARYSGHGREERVDRLYADELSQFAERAVLALLHDRPISATIMRDTVLRNDSQRSVQRIHGTHHFLCGLGTQVRLGRVPTVAKGGGTKEELRIFSPMTLAAGYRARFENWGLETMGHLSIGTTKTALRDNTAGGHIDLGGSFGTNLHFLLYTNPRGVSSFYLGGGSTFEVLWLSVIRPEDKRIGDDRRTIFSGGLTVDLVTGWELMRASVVQFLLQAELNLPAYVARSENSDGGIDSWLPGASVKLGMMF